MTDAVRHVAQQEFLPARHAEVAYHEDVDGLAFRRLHDGHGRIVVQNHGSMAQIAGQLPHVSGQLVAGRYRARPLGRAEFCGCGGLRLDHLHHMRSTAPASTTIQKDPATNGFPKGHLPWKQGDN